MFLHIGFALTWQNLRASDGETRYRARPNTGTGARTVDTGDIGASDELIYGLEIAFRIKSIHFQGEFFSATPSSSRSQPRSQRSRGFLRWLTDGH